MRIKNGHICINQNLYYTSMFTKVYEFRVYSTLVVVEWRVLRLLL